jgi:hypothetical protein
VAVLSDKILGQLMEDMMNDSMEVLDNVDYAELVDDTKNMSAQQKQDYLSEWLINRKEGRMRYENSLTKVKKVRVTPKPSEGAMVIPNNNMMIPNDNTMVEPVNPGGGDERFRRIIGLSHPYPSFVAGLTGQEKKGKQKRIHTIVSKYNSLVVTDPLAAFLALTNSKSDERKKREVVEVLRYEYPDFTLPESSSSSSESSSSGEESSSEDDVVEIGGEDDVRPNNSRMVQPEGVTSQSFRAPPVNQPQNVDNRNVEVILPVKSSTNAWTAMAGKRVAETKIGVLLESSNYNVDLDIGLVLSDEAAFVKDSLQSRLSHELIIGSFVGCLLKKTEGDFNSEVAATRSVAAYRVIDMSENRSSMDLQLVTTFNMDVGEKEVEPPVKVSVPFPKRVLVFSAKFIKENLISLCAGEPLVGRVVGRSAEAGPSISGMGEEKYTIYNIDGVVFKGVFAKQTASVKIANTIVILRLAAAERRSTFLTDSKYEFVAETVYAFFICQAATITNVSWGGTEEGKIWQSLFIYRQIKDIPVICNPEYFVFFFSGGKHYTGTITQLNLGYFVEHFDPADPLDTMEAVRNIEHVLCFMYGNQYSNVVIELQKYVTKWAMTRQPMIVYGIEQHVLKPWFHRMSQPDEGDDVLDFMNNIGAGPNFLMNLINKFVVKVLDYSQFDNYNGRPEPRVYFHRSIDVKELNIAAVKTDLGKDMVKVAKKRKEVTNKKEHVEVKKVRNESGSFDSGSEMETNPQRQRKFSGICVNALVKDLRDQGKVIESKIKGCGFVDCLFMHPVDYQGWSMAKVWDSVKTARPFLQDQKLAADVKAALGV